MGYGFARAPIEATGSGSPVAAAAQDVSLGTSFDAGLRLGARRCGYHERYDGDGG